MPDAQPVAATPECPRCRARGRVVIECVIGSEKDAHGKPVAMTEIKVYVCAVCNRLLWKA
jgi:hypothetical protein